MLWLSVTILMFDVEWFKQKISTCKFTACTVFFSTSSESTS